MLRRAALALPLALPAARAEARSLRIIVPFAPGGSGDITARLIAQYLERTAGQAVVVDNRPGANGVIGTMAVKLAPADGQTWLLATTSTHSANPSLVRDLPYDPERDFRTLGFFGSNGSYLLVRPQGPWRSLPELLAAVRQPGLFFGYFNASSRVPGELLNAFGDGRLQGVPYRTIGAALADLLAGRIDLIFADTTAGDAHVKDGTLRPLAITRDGRWSRWPDLPALSEIWPDFVLTGFLGIAVPAATPAALCETLNHRINDAILAEPAHGRLLEFGFIPTRLALPRIAELVRAEREKWSRFVALAGISPE